MYACYGNPRLVLQRVAELWPEFSPSAYLTDTQLSRVKRLPRGLDSVGGIDGLLKAPGVALTPAAGERRIVTMDDLYLLGFGPRLGQAIRDLAIFLHPALQRDRQ